MMCNCPDARCLLIQALARLVREATIAKQSSNEKPKQRKVA